MTLLPLPALTDNYIWVLHDGKEAIAVDPGTATPVLELLDRENLQLRAILVTHHHPDHTAGIAPLAAHTLAPVYGPGAESIPKPFHAVDEHSVLTFLGWQFQVLVVPGHTRGHLAYFGQRAGQAPVLFCGDTLFSAGCGRVLEGTHAQLNDALQRFCALNADTRICCAHEYTLANIRFALTVDPDNLQLQHYFTQCLKLRAEQRPTLPSTLSTECAINPFLRCQEPAIRAAAMGYDSLMVHDHGVFYTLRQWKNHYA